MHRKLDRSLFEAVQGFGDLTFGECRPDVSRPSASFVVATNAIDLSYLVQNKPGMTREREREGRRTKVNFEI